MGLGKSTSCVVGSISPARGYQVVRMAVLRDKALFYRKNQDAACKYGLSEDQQAEVSMLMGAGTADCNLLQRCRNTEVSASLGYV